MSKDVSENNCQGTSECLDKSENSHLDPEQEVEYEVVDQKKKETP